MYLDDKGLDSLYKLAKNGTTDRRHGGSSSSGSAPVSECKVEDVTLNGESLVVHKVAKLDDVAAAVELEVTTEEETEVNIDVEDDSYTKEETDALLEGKADASALEAETERAEKAEEANASAISGKADKDHTHAISDVTGLQTALDDKANASALEAEAERAKAAEEANASAISEEAEARATADTTLQTNIDKKEDSFNKTTNLDLSTTNFPTCSAVRSYVDAADEYLEGKIDNEATTRQTADETLQNNIDNATTPTEIQLETQDAIEIVIETDDGPEIITESTTLELGKSYLVIPSADITLTLPQGNTEKGLIDIRICDYQGFAWTFKNGSGLNIESGTGNVHLDVFTDGVEWYHVWMSASQHDIG